MAKFSKSAIENSRSISCGRCSESLCTKSGSVTKGEDMPTISACCKASKADSGELIPPLAIKGMRPAKCS